MNITQIILNILWGSQKASFVLKVFKIELSGPGRDDEPIVEVKVDGGHAEQNSQIKVRKKYYKYISHEGVITSNNFASKSRINHFVKIVPSKGQNVKIDRESVSSFIPLGPWGFWCHREKCHRTIWRSDCRQSECFLISLIKES